MASAAEAEKLPTAEDVAKGLEEAGKLEAEEEAFLETPQAEREREQSQLAYADISAEDAEDLLRSEFAEELALVDRDPARTLTAVQLEQAVGSTGALIDVGGDTVLMDGTMPVRTLDEEGDLGKVNLELRPTEDGYTPANPLTDLELPADVSEPMTVGDSGLAIAPVLSEGGSAARPFGETDLIYPLPAQDMDLLAAPIASGLELFANLRSEASPEQLRFALTLPPGAELRSDGNGGAEVIGENHPIANIPAPTAVDAQGTDVPVTMRLEGDDLVLETAHRSMDVAYPILVDPIVDEWYSYYGGTSWYSGGSLGALSDGTWAYTSSDWGRFVPGTSPTNSTFGGSNRGLFISAKSISETQWAYRYGQWSYTAPGSTTFIPAAGVYPLWRHDHNCPAGQYPQPHDYVGLWSPAWSPTYGWITFQANHANAYGQADTTPPKDWREKTAQIYAIGLGTGAYNTAAIPCWRDLYAGGAYVWLDDAEDPSIGSINGIPTGWFTDSPPLSITVSTSDPGLGVRRVKLLGDGKGIIGEDTVGGCTGLRAKPCPANRNSQLTPTAASFGEGIRQGNVTVEDPLGKKTEGGAFTTRVDRSVPEVSLSGQLATVTDEDEGEVKGDEKTETLRLPVYKLTIKATDIGTESDAEKKKRSGVKDIKVFLDGNEMAVPWQPTASCPQTSCPKEGTYTLALSKVETAGKHKLLVKTIDFAGNEKVRDIEFQYFPATGMKDEYAMHYFPLPDGTGNEDEEEHPDRPELAVNVMNGNLVYREQDVEVDGTATVDLKVERYYNSMLPNSENTEWGDGWTLAETPDMELLDTGGSPAPDAANLLGSDGALEGGVDLPTEGAAKFDPSLRATLEKSPSGGYVLTDETGESATKIHFDETGQTEALLTEGYAKVDYSYEGGHLSEIEVIDPSTFAADPSELQIPKPQLVTSPLYASLFGSNGSGDGQFKSPSDVAVDSAGSIYVADRLNNRVQKFDPSGKFVSKFGTQGSGNGQLNQPAALAIDSAGNIWVADKGNSRIQKFNSKGEYLAKFGSVGSGNGQFASGGPEGVAVDSKGNVWVSDTYGGRVQKFNSAGEFVKVISSKGSGSGQLGEPTGLDVAPDGKVWVADWQNNRVAVFSEAGEFVFQFGVQGTGNGAFSHPDEIEIDANGAVWVGDQGNNRIQQFNQGAQYVAQFGSSGSTEGKFNFAFPLGIATDSKGSLWVADVNNHRIQRWRVPVPKPTYASSFGLNGSGDGQLSTPADVAIDLQGNLWVADKGNNRIQKFDPSGKFLAKYGSLGSGNGQFNKPSSIAVDRDGNILVADTENHRIQKLNTAGEFLSKFGSQGSGNGQLNKPEEVVANAKGDIYVADTLNGRVQRFDEEGKFLQVIDSGQLYEPAGLDVDAAGNLWVADWQKHRISIFDPEGGFKSNIGSEGTGNGQFKRPDAIEIDNKGNVWVADLGNNRIQRFDLAGNYVGQLGSFGTGAGQFVFMFSSYFPTGIAADREGHLWIVDPSPFGARIQQWLTASYAPAQATQLDLGDGDAKVEVETSSGLITSLSGNAAGEHSYAHEGNFLTSHEGPEGKTTYQKDSSGRLSKITLPNSTWAEIKYFADNRVQSVKVSIEGAAAKTTYFEYQDDPRRTIVDPDDAPFVTYDIGEDGSVFKWWNTQKPPELKLAGTLYDNREVDGKLWPGDHELEATAESEEGIASIKVLANGTDLVDEKTCAQIPGPPVECKKEVNSWVTSTDLHAPGHLVMEVVATDSNGYGTSKRFWVDIPQPPPPPPPGAPIPPTFHEIADFRKEHGLEIVFPVANETELNERIFDLIKAWNEPNTTLGAVARESWQRWGVPLRPADVAELEYRQQYFAHDIPRIDDWAHDNLSGTYAGVFVDEPSGGLMRIGFTANQASSVSTTASSAGLMAKDRTAGFTSVPTYSIEALKGVEDQVRAAIPSLPEGLIVSVGIDVELNRVAVGATSVIEAEARLKESLGQQVPISVSYEEGLEELAARKKISGRILAGDFLRTPTMGTCSAGYGAVRKLKSGEKVNYLLTAAHCAKIAQVMIGHTIYRENNAGDTAVVGVVERSGWSLDLKEYSADGAAINLTGTLGPARYINPGQGSLIPVESVSPMPPAGIRLCHSGFRTDAKLCGKVRKAKFYYDGVVKNRLLAQFCFVARVKKGDSGGPVWIEGTHTAVGLATNGRKSIGNETYSETCAAALIPNEEITADAAILTNSKLQPLGLAYAP